VAVGGDPIRVDDEPGAVLGVRVGFYDIRIIRPAPDGDFGLDLDNDPHDAGEDPHDPGGRDQLVLLGAYLPGAGRPRDEDHEAAQQAEQDSGVTPPTPSVKREPPLLDVSYSSAAHDVLPRKGW
jgi:hypothetical protein